MFITRQSAKKKEKQRAKIIHKGTCFRFVMVFSYLADVIMTDIFETSYKSFQLKLQHKTAI